MHPRGFLAALISINKLRKSHPFQLVHGHGISTLPLARCVGGVFKCPVIITLHNVPAPTFIENVVLKGLAKGVQFIAVSDAVRLSVAFTKQDKIHTVYNGVPEQTVQSTRDNARALLALPLDGALVVAVSRLSIEKGLDILAKAAPYIHAMVAVVGEGPHRTHLEKLGSVRLIGHVDEPKLWFEAANIVVVPSRTEGLGMTAIEALSYGRPVVASRVGGLLEVIREPTTGLLIESDDPQVWAARINETLSNRALCDAALIVGPETVRTRFSIPVMHSKTSQIYKAALSK